MFELKIDSEGSLWNGNSFQSGGKPERVRIIQNFPWTAPDSCFSFVTEEGKEAGWLSSLEDLPLKQREAVRRILLECAFVFEVLSVDSVEEDVELRHWTVTTTQGNRRFQTR
ncbi:MAG: DUF1854 domain-containing protein, partial [Bdellovibrionota bacterium]